MIALPYVQGIESVLQHTFELPVPGKCRSVVHNVCKHAMQEQSMAGYNSHLTAHHLLGVVHSTAGRQTHTASCACNQHSWPHLPPDVTAGCH